MTGTRVQSVAMLLVFALVLVGPALVDMILGGD